MDHDKYIGRLLDNRYEIQEVIGIGGMAVVYKARCHRLNRLVAIKILKDDYSRDEDFRRRFHAESQAVAMLSHPNIVSVYDVSSGEADYIVMELIDGISLKQYMEMKGILNWKETLHFAMQIAKALEHAHSRGIVHRDIKPHNVMVLKNGSVKVTDFGIARIMSKGNTLTKEALGSVHYISPEQAKGGRVDNRSDLYSLGVVMYEMMAGRPPYDGESPVSVAIQHINGGAAMPSTLNPNIPTGMEQIIMKGMAHDPADRYESATAMLYDMERFRQDPAFVFPFAVASRVGSDTIAMDPINPVMRAGDGAAKGQYAMNQSASQRPGASGANQRPASSSGSQQMPQRGGQTGQRPSQAAQRANQASGSRNSGRTPVAPPVYGGNRNSQGRTGAQTTMSSTAAAQARRAAAARRRAEEQEERSNRFAMIAVIVCAVVLALAILIIVGMVFTGNSSAPKKDSTAVHTVPSFVGQYWESVKPYPPEGVEFDEEVVLQYHETYKEDQIISQNPAAGTVIGSGETVKVNVTVSMGKEPLVKTMENLTNVSLETAQNFLNGLKMSFNILPIEEFNDTVEKGCVILTDPAVGQPLSEGQTIKIYVSKGPEFVKNPVPNVIGRPLSTALQMLELNGFKSVIVEGVESNEDKDEVVGISVPVNEPLDVTTQIILQVSNGPTTPPATTPPPVTTPQPTTPPPTTPTTPPESVPTESTPAPVTETLVFMLDADRGADVVVSVICLETQQSVYAATVTPEDSNMITVTVSGTGTQTYVLYVGGVEDDRQVVTF